MPPQLDPFIIYTVKLAMDFKSVEPTTPIPTRSTKPFEKNTMIQEDTEKSAAQHQDNFTNPMFPETMARIMTIKSFPLKSGEKAPKLRRDNVLSLLYHADEQWLNSSLDLSKVVIHGDEKGIQYAVEHVHHQQRIYLDTLHLLHKAVFPNEPHRRFNEPIWFAAQVLHSQCQIRHLEYFTGIISPLATKVYESMEQIRSVTRRLLSKQQVLRQQYQQQQTSFISSLFSSFIASTNSSYPGSGFNSTDKGFYDSKEHQAFLRKLEPYLVALSYHWAAFERTLYECYVHTVFGKYHTNVIMEEQQKSTSLCQEILQQQQQQQLPNELFHDHFTQLLPIILERAINLQIIDIQSIQSLDPIAFVAVPRLAILAGVTWLAHLTGWRNKKALCSSSNLPVWIKSHLENLNRITLALDQLEIQLLKNQSEDAHHSFVQRYQKLEQALVSGRSMKQEQQDDDKNNDDICEQLEKEIFLDICAVADSVLSSNRAQAFTIVLCHLFRHFGLQYDIEFEESEDAVPLDQTVLDLAI